LVPVPAILSADIAALTEPLATALASFKGVELGPTSRVAVIGCGSIGLLTIYAAALAGWTVTATDPIAERRNAAVELGAQTIVATADNFEAGTMDLVVDAVGIETTWSAAVRAVRPGGDVAIVGLGQFAGSVEVGDLVRRGITLRGSYAYNRDDFAAALAMLAMAPPSAKWLKRLPLKEGPAAFASLADQSSTGIKILLQPALGRD